MKLDFLEPSHKLVIVIKEDKLSSDHARTVCGAQLSFHEALIIVNSEDL